ncbi:MAG: hypothetical protein R2747_08660 [Pyrinomonadaceae bacterium]
MRNKIAGGIGILWGGGMLASHFFGGSSPGGSGAYRAGQTAGLIFAVLIFVLGLYYFFKKSS